jgi:hypothetical protein
MGENTTCQKLQQIFRLHYTTHIIIYWDATPFSFLRQDRLHLKCDGTCAETRFHLSAKQMSPFKSAGASVQSITGIQSVCTSGSNAGYTMSRGRVKSTGYPLHSPVSPSLPLPCVTMCHHISTGLYLCFEETYCPHIQTRSVSYPDWARMFP